MQRLEERSHVSSTPVSSSLKDLMLAFGFTGKLQLLKPSHVDQPIRGNCADLILFITDHKDMKGGTHT